MFTILKITKFYSVLILRDICQQTPTVLIQVAQLAQVPLR